MIFFELEARLFTIFLEKLLFGQFAGDPLFYSLKFKFHHTFF